MIRWSSSSSARKKLQMRKKLEIEIVQFLKKMIDPMSEVIFTLDENFRRRKSRRGRFEIMSITEVLLIWPALMNKLVNYMTRYLYN